MKPLLIISLTLSIIFTQMIHPLAMGLILLLQTISVSIITGLLMQSFWFSYILFLIFVGGMLILFIYVTTLASNEMFSMSMKLIILPMIITPLLLMSEDFWHFFEIKNQDSEPFLMLNNQTMIPLRKFYNYPTSIITILLATYLFLTLIVVVKIIDISIGPLRQMN